MPNFIPGLKSVAPMTLKTLNQLTEERKRKVASQSKGDNANAFSRAKRIFCGKDETGYVISLSKREFDRLTWRI
jgi:hypothetical protein